MLSVFLNLDPTEFATPPARSSAITSVMTAAAHKIESKEELSHDERIALKDDVERVRNVLAGSDLATNGTRGVAIYACKELDVLEVLKLRRPIDSKVVLDRTPFIEPLVLQGTDEQWMVLLSNRRATRIFVGPGDELEETDRIVDDIHSKHDQGGWSQLNYQRSIEKDVSDHIGRAAELAFEIYKKRALDRVLIGAPEELLGELKSKLHPYLRERIAGKLGVDTENASLDDVRAEASRAMEAHARKSEREALDRLVEAVGRAGRRRGHRGGARRPQSGTGGDAADRRELPRQRAPQRRGRPAAAEDAEPGEPVDDIVEPAIEKAIEQSASPLVVRDHDDLQPLGGIGAVLRF